MSPRLIISILFTFIGFASQASIYCPSNVTLYCNDDIHFLQQTGKATAIGYHPTFVRYHDISYLNQCNIGTIHRIWYIDVNQDHQYQSTESSCTQILTLLGLDGQITIYFPENKTYQCKEEISNDKPTWTSGSCDVLGYHVDDTVYEVAEDACYKIFRKFTVINWCTYDPQSTSGYGKWTHTQIIKVLENAPPTITDCTDKVIGLEADCKAAFTIKNSAFDDAGCPSQLLTWTVEIDLWADGTTDYRYGINEAGANKLGPVANNQVISITLPERIGTGKHKVHWSVKDQCGNFRSCHTNVETKDIKKPTPYMHDFLTSSFQGDVMDLMVHARIFNINSFDNCTPATKLKYSFSTNVHDTVRTINCGNAGFQFFTVYVSDIQGNQEFANVFMLIFDNGSCNGTPGISGRIAESNTTPIKDAQVSLTRNGMTPNISTSNTEGVFKWSDISMYSDYKITPELSAYHPERIDIADLKKLQNHIMGLEKLTNFEYLAADLDGDSKIRISDLERMKKKILYPTDEGTLNWEFAAELDTIRSADDLTNIDKVFDILKYDGNIDFKAICKGNISGANQIETEHRSTTTLSQKKQEGMVAYFIKEDVEIKGLQIEILIKDKEDMPEIYSPYFKLSDPAIHFSTLHQSIRFVSLENFKTIKDQPLFVVKSANETVNPEISAFSKILLNGDQVSKLTLDRAAEFVNEDHIFPNPGNGTFNIREPYSKIESITDLSGKPVLFTQNNQEFSLQVPPGLYIVHLTHQGITRPAKLIVH